MVLMYDLAVKIDKNGIQSENIYNFDETGFAMDLISVQKVITRIEYYS